MKYNLYAIWDDKAMQYSAPFIAENDEVAIRQFKYQCIRPDSPYLADPESFILCRIGVYSTSYVVESFIDDKFDLFSAKEFINGKV